MKKRIWTLFLALALTLSLTGSAFAAKTSIEVSSPEEMASALAPQAGVFSLRAGRTPARVLLLADEAADFRGAARVIRWPALGMFVLEYESEAKALAAVDFFGADRAWLDTPEQGARVLDGGTTDVDPDPTETPAPSLGYTARSWGAAEMGLETFRNDSKAMAHLRDRHVTVAVLDTGADMTVPLFSERALSEESYDFVSDTPELTDIPTGAAAGHGTMVTSLLCDLLPEQTELMVLRVFDDNGSASRAMILTALEYALEHGADVVNMSLGWEKADSSYTFLNSMLDRLRAQGVTVVCAAGNRGADAATCYPASYEATISVSAVNQTLNIESFSNFGSTVDFAAPGSGLRLITLGGAEKTDKGTSFAAPHISALAADMLLCEDLSPELLYQDLKANCEDLGYTGRDDQYGWGFPRLNDFAANADTHVWGEWVETRPAAEDAEGEETRTCVCGETETRSTPKLPPFNPFSDVSEEEYYFRPVLWAVKHDPQITNGTSATTFSPDNACTRAQAVTFLWRAFGMEQVTGANPFKDVRESDYYYTAVLWAVKHGITNGTDATHFSPDLPCSRAHIVTFLYRAEGSPAADPAVTPAAQREAVGGFVDVFSDQYFAGAVLWAVQNGITNGVSSTSFAPDNVCTRGQIVTFLHRDLG